MPDLGKEAQRELDILLQTREAHEGILSLVLKQKKAWVDSKGQVLEVEKATEEWRDIYKDIQRQLQGSIKNVQHLSEVTAGAVDNAMAIARAHKLSAQQAAEVVKKQIEQRENARKTLKDLGKSKVLEGLKWLVTGATLAKAYETNLREVYRAQELLLSSTAATGSANEAAWKDLPAYMQSYRDVTRDAAKVAARWGVSTEEARQAQDAMFDSLSGLYTAGSQYKTMVKTATESLLAYSKMSGQTVPEAQEDLQRSMRAEGKTLQSAIADQDRAIAGYNNLAKSVHTAAWPTRKEYFQALKDVRHELGPVRVNISAVTAAMSEFAAASSKAGGTAENVKQAMQALPKVLEGLPQYFKIKIGEGYVKAMKPGSKAHADLIAKLKAEDPSGKLVQRAQAVMKLNVAGFQKARMMQNVLKGTTFGIEDTLKSWGTMSDSMLSGQLEQLGLNQDQVLDTIGAIRKGSKEGIKKAAKDIEEAQKKVKKESLPERLKDNADAVGRAVLKTAELKGSVDSLITSNITLIAAVTAATAMGWKAIGLLKTLSAAGGLRGLLGGGGVPGLPGAPAAGPPPAAGGAKSVLAAGGAKALAAAALPIAVGVAGAAALSYAAGPDAERRKEIREKALKSGKGEEGAKAAVALEEMRSSATPLSALVGIIKNVARADKRKVEGVTSEARAALDAAKKAYADKVKPKPRAADVMRLTDVATANMNKAVAAAQAAVSTSPRARAEKITDQQRMEDARWAPPPKTTARVGAATIAPDVKPLAPGAGAVQPQAAAAPPRPAQLRYDPTTRQLTIIKLDDPALIQAGVDFLNSVKQPKR
jgi:hypothetical protein